MSTGPAVGRQVRLLALQCCLSVDRRHFVFVLFVFSVFRAIDHLLPQLSAKSRSAVPIISFAVSNHNCLCWEISMLVLLF